MKVTFVSIGYEQLAIELLSSILKQHGHQVSLAYSASLFNDRFQFDIGWLSKIFDDRKLLLKQIEVEQPDILAFSPLTGTYQWALGVAREAKQLVKGVKVIFGGVHTSAVPEIVIENEEVDFAVVGEGDIALPALLKQLSQGPVTQSLNNVLYKQGGRVIRGQQAAFIQDLDILPFFDKPLYEDFFDIGDFYLTMASRGCPYRCTFCFNNFFANLPDGRGGKYVRLRSVEHVMQELRWAKRRYNLRHISFDDDIFTTNKAWLKEFLTRYKKEINVPFQCLSHPRYMDDEIARLLAEAGCTWIQIGVQSMAEEFKFKELKRKERSNHIEIALEALYKHRINVKVDHMLGLPGEPLEAQEKARRLYTEFPPERISIYYTQLLPGTEMMQKAIAAGELSLENAVKINQGFDGGTYHDALKRKDKKMVKFYYAYELIFRLVSILPAFLRKKLRYGFFKVFPAFLLKSAAWSIDLVIGLGQRNPVFNSYLRYYLYQVRAILLRKAGISVGKPTKVRVEIPLPAPIIRAPSLAGVKKVS